MYTYPALFTPAKEGGYVITFPDVPEAITQGDTLEEAGRMASDALETGLSFYIDKRQDLPKPSRQKGKQIRHVSVSALVAAKLALYSQLRASGLRKAELARRMGITKQAAERLFDLTHASRLDQIEKGLAVLGKRLTVTLEDAA